MKDSPNLSDLVAELFEQMNHIGVMDKVRTNHQTQEWWLKIMANEEYQKAQLRKWERWRKFLEETSRIVDSWPDWKKGIVKK